MKDIPKREENRQMVPKEEEEGVRLPKIGREKKGREIDVGGEASRAWIFTD